MNGERNSSNRKSAIALLVLLVLPPVYILSSGPAALMLGDGQLGITAWNVAYRPAGWLAGTTGTERPYLRYVQWWINLPR
jgi:hypothetical protein